MLVDAEGKVVDQRPTDSQRMGNLAATERGLMWAETKSVHILGPAGETTYPLPRDQAVGHFALRGKTRPLLFLNEGQDGDEYSVVVADSTGDTRSVPGMVELAAECEGTQWAIAHDRIGSRARALWKLSPGADPTTVRLVDANPYESAYLHAAACDDGVIYAPVLLERGEAVLGRFDTRSGRRFPDLRIETSALPEQREAVIVLSSKVLAGRFWWVTTGGKVLSMPKNGGQVRLEHEFPGLPADDIRGAVADWGDTEILYAQESSTGEVSYFVWRPGSSGSGPHPLDGWQPDAAVTLTDLVRLAPSALPAGSASADASPGVPQANSPSAR